MKEEGICFQKPVDVYDRCSYQIARGFCSRWIFSIGGSKELHVDLRLFSKGEVDDDARNIVEIFTRRKFWIVSNDVEKLVDRVL